MEEVIKISLQKWPHSSPKSVYSWVVTWEHCCVIPGHSVSLSSWFEMGEAGEEAATRISLQKWQLTAQPCHCAHPLYDPIPPYYQGWGARQQSIVHTTKLGSRRLRPLLLSLFLPHHLHLFGPFMSASDVVCFYFLSRFLNFIQSIELLGLT